MGRLLKEAVKKPEKLQQCQAKEVLVERKKEAIEEAAAAIFFLATPKSSFTTGSTVDVSGGLSRHVG